MRFEHLVRAFGQALGEALAENGKFRFEREDEEDWQTLEEIRLIRADCSSSRFELEAARVRLTPQGFRRR
jgi:hypothetical protein